MIHHNVDYLNTKLCQQLMISELIMYIHPYIQCENNSYVKDFWYINHKFSKGCIFSQFHKYQIHKIEYQHSHQVNTGSNSNNIIEWLFIHFQKLRLATYPFEMFPSIYEQCIMFYYQALQNLYNLLKRSVSQWLNHLFTEQYTVVCTQFTLPIRCILWCFLFLVILNTCNLFWSWMVSSLYKRN